MGTTGPVGLRVSCQAGRRASTSVMAHAEGAVSWGLAGKKYGKDTGLLGYSVECFFQESLGLSHKVPDSRAGSSNGIQGNGLSLDELGGDGQLPTLWDLESSWKPICGLVCERLSGFTEVGKPP